MKDTQPFPPDEEEAAAPSSAEAAVEDVLGIEVEASQPEVAPVKSGPLELEVEEVQAEAEPVMTPIPDQIEPPALELESEPVTEEPLSVEQIVPEEEVAVPAINTQQELSGDLDHVLDLDDVLPEVWPQTIMVPQAESPHPAVAESTNDFHPAPSAIPQAVIDEIVNRVVAQLSEKLSGNLAGNLAEKLASQLAPEVAELVKHQTQSETSVRPSPAPLNQDSDSLLDLD